MLYFWRLENTLIDLDCGDRACSCPSAGTDVTQKKQLTSIWVSLLSRYWMMKASWEEPWVWTEPRVRHREKRKRRSTPDITEASLLVSLETRAAAVRLEELFLRSCSTELSEVTVLLLKATPEPNVSSCFIQEAFRPAASRTFCLGSLISCCFTGFWIQVNLTHSPSQSVAHSSTLWVLVHLRYEGTTQQRRGKRDSESWK